MNRRLWIGVVAGLLAAATLLSVGIGAYRAGQGDEAVTRVVETPSGEVVRVVERDGPWGHWGPGPGFFLVPLLIVLLVVLVTRGGGHRHGYGWHRPYGPGPGYGPGSGPGYGYSYGHGHDPGHAAGHAPAAWAHDLGPDETLEDWHRRAHEGMGPPGGSSAAAEPARQQDDDTAG